LRGPVLGPDELGFVGRDGVCAVLAGVPAAFSGVPVIAAVLTFFSSSLEVKPTAAAD
jgi:hypothetical protein